LLLADAQQLRNYNEGRVRAGYAPIRIGIGLNTGLSMVGTVGSLSRMEGTVISDAVNLASRMESLSKAYGIPLLISEHTYHNIGKSSLYDLRFIDRVRVKGKKQPQSVYEIFNEDEVESRRLKNETKALFEEALANYHYKNVEEAREQLASCLGFNPDDEPAKVYLRRCDAYLESGAFEGTCELNERIEWSREFETGLAQIDEQHKQLFSGSNALLAAVEGKRSIDEVLRIIDDLGASVKEHFKTEEGIMREQDYPFLDHQRGQHEKFLLAFGHVRGEVRAKDMSRSYLLFRIQTLWIDWLINHTFKEDGHFGKFVAYKNRR
jgi:hemerythrin-like metal-binding protein